MTELRSVETIYGKVAAYAVPACYRMIKSFI